MPYGRHLHADERKRLEALIKVFIAGKHIEGCGGLEITDEIKVTIAAQACLLLLNLHHNYFERLTSVVVYPESFDFAQEEAGLADGTMEMRSLRAAGLSSAMGAVVLSWPDTVRGGLNSDDGFNAILHEFAHQLDQLDGVMNGAPVLEGGAIYREWAQVLGSEHQRLQAEVETGASSLISAHGANALAIGSWNAFHISGEHDQQPCQR